MYITLLLISVLSFAVQTCLMAPCYRKLDPLTTAGFRGISLAVTMSPLLLFVSAPSFSDFIRIFPVLIAASITAAVGNALGGLAFRYWPIGISNAVYGGAKGIAGVLIAIIWLGERLTLNQIICIACVLSLIAFLGVSKSSSQKLTSENNTLGFTFSVGCGLALAIAFNLVADMVRIIDPLAVAYAWEVSIGAFALIAARCRSMLKNEAPPAVGKAALIQILLRSSPTLLGTGCFALALLHGPASIAIVVLASEMAFTSIIASLLFKEQIQAKQWIAILGIMAGIVGLELFT